MSAHHAHETHAHGAGDHHHDASHSPAHYVRIWGVLCVLLAVSVAGPELEIPVVTLLTAFGIAFVKAYLVIKHFMHLDLERPVIWYILTTGIAFMLMMFAAVSIDVQNHDGARWTNDGAKAAIVAGMAYGDPADHHTADHGAAADHAPAEGHAAPAGH
jgi:caa(3)-type oxidase subunit IV